MGTTTVEAVLEKAVELLQDDDFVRWTREDLKEWLAFGELELCILKPNAYVINGPLQLVKGTLQTLPANGNTFMDVIYGLGVDGNTIGRAPRFIQKKILDEQQRNWHRDTPNVEPLHYTFDNRDPKHFYVWPPQPEAAAKVQVMYTATPPALGNTINVDDIYVPPLVNYVVYRAYSKDTSYAGNADRAMAYLKLFMDLLGAKAAGEVANNASNNTAGSQAGTA